MSYRHLYNLLILLALVVSRVEYSFGKPSNTMPGAVAQEAQIAIGKLKQGLSQAAEASKDKGIMLRDRCAGARCVDPIYQQQLKEYKQQGAKVEFTAQGAQIKPKAQSGKPVQNSVSQININRLDSLRNTGIGGQTPLPFGRRGLPLKVNSKLLQERGIMGPGR